MEAIRKVLADGNDENHRKRLDAARQLQQQREDIRRFIEEQAQKLTSNQILEVWEAIAAKSGPKNESDEE